MCSGMEVNKIHYTVYTALATHMYFVMQASALYRAFNKLASHESGPVEPVGLVGPWPNQNLDSAWRHQCTIVYN